MNSTSIVEDKNVLLANISNVLLVHPFPDHNWWITIKGYVYEVDQVNDMVNNGYERTLIVRKVKKV